MAQKVAFICRRALYSMNRRTRFENRRESWIMAGADYGRTVFCVQKEKYLLLLRLSLKKLHCPEKRDKFQKIGLFFRYSIEYFSEFENSIHVTRTRTN